MKKILHKSIFALLLSVVFCPLGFAQSYLGVEGGFEGTATIDNTNLSSAGVLNTWGKNNATTTIANETTTVRSGSNALRINNSSGTARRVYSPLIQASTSSPVVVQYYRRVANTTNCNENQHGINRNGTESLSGSYTTPSAANVWEKVTYEPTGTTATNNNLFAVLLTRAKGSGGDVFIDDFCVYVAGATDVSAPNSPGTASTSAVTTSGMDVAWGAASGGVDNGGYMVVRYSVSPNADNDPNVNGIYNVGNTIANGTGGLIGTVRYVGTGTSFTDSGLSSGSTYYYKVYTFDKAFNYSGEVSASGTTTPATPTVTTTAASSIGLAGATLNGTINPNGLTTDASFEYGTTNAYGTSIASTSGMTGSAALPVSAVIPSGLAVNTQYHFRAVGTVSGTPTNGSDLTFYTLANTPGIPVVNNPTVSSLDVAINQNSNPANTTYAIHETTTDSFVQSLTGALGATADYQTAAIWGTKTVTGLNDNTTYTFEVKARNGDNVETAYSSQASGTTIQNLSPEITVTDSVDAFGDVCINANAKNMLTFDGANLDGSNVVLGAVSGYSYSLSENGTYTSTLNISYAGTSFTGQVVWVQFSPTAVTAYNGSIQFTGGGLAPTFPSTSLSGAGVNTAAGATTAGAGSVTATAAELSGSLIPGCSAFTYGIAYSTVTGFATGTQVASSNLAGGSFSSSLTGLEPNTVYYYKAYVTDLTGTHYGSESNFLTSGLGVPTALGASDVTHNHFTANWQPLDGADSYRLDVSTSPSFGTTQNMSDLIISEYIEGNSNNKAIEIYNGTGASVDLSQYTLKKQTNGAGGFSSDVDLSGTLLNGEVYVVANSSSDAAILAQADETNAGLNTFNGNDVVALYKNGTQIDVVGVVNQVSNWGANVTLVRKSTVTAPTVSYNINDWTSFPVDTFTNLGAHSHEGSVPSFVSGYENLTVNGTSQLVDGPEILPSTTYYYRVRGVSDNSTSANSTPAIAVTTLAAPPTFGSISQAVAIVCDGGQATFNVTGLLADKTSTLTFNINNQPSQTVDVSADATGFGTFNLGLSVAQNGQILTVTAVDRTDLPGNEVAVTTNNTVTLAISANTTYYADLDNDGFGDPNSSTLSCTGAPVGYVLDNTDCDDSQTLYTDADGDGFGTLPKVACGGVADNSDCDDTQVLYADVDGDGYGSLVKVACGGSTSNTDCDDNNNQVHPGQPEIGYNLIDDNCDGSIDEGFPPKNTTIQSSQCGATLASIDTQLFANLVAGAQGYKWRVTTMSGPTAGQVQFLATPLRAMRLVQLANYAFSTTYKIEVAVFYAGYLQPYLASDCTVTTPAATTSLMNCAQTLTAMANVIYANNVPYATGYRFRVSDGINTAVLDRAVREFRMNLITNFQPKFNKQYTVEVAVRNTTGEYLPYGSACTIMTPLFPTSFIQDSQCNDYAPATLNTMIYANSYPGAIAYVFNLTGNGLPAEGIEVTRTTRAFKLADFTGLIPSATYSVRVRLIFDYNDQPGPYGKVCSVVVPGAVRLAKLPFDAVVYPNPFTERFNLDVNTSVKAPIGIKVYDMTGRLLEQQTLDVSKLESAAIGDQFPSGVYNVIISQGDETKTLRVVKR